MSIPHVWRIEWVAIMRLHEWLREQEEEGWDVFSIIPRGADAYVVLRRPA